MAQPTNQEKIGLLQSVFDLPEDEILTIVKKANIVYIKSSNI